MAAAQIGPIGPGSGLYGTSITFNYDDVTLVLSSFTVRCGTVAPEVFWYQTSGGSVVSHAVPMGTAVATFTLPAVIQGVQGNVTITNPDGTQTTLINVLHWPTIVQMGCGNAPTVTPPAAI